MVKIENKGKTDEYVYDISLDGTVINALGNNVASNTDGFNFKLPPESELSCRKYVSKGLSRETVKDKEYTGFEADRAEFNDLFMRNKMGLGLDEVIYASVNLKRKNYLDLLINEKTGEKEVKMVGNSIKSRKMSGFIEDFINENCQLLLNNDGYTFLKNYYDYIDKIYNYQIPLSKIAAKGKIKKTIKEYEKDCKTFTKAGNLKSRQAWYELAIREKLDVSMGETIYYINNGTKKGDSDVKRVTTKFVKGEDGKDEPLKGKVKSSLLKKICSEKGIEYKSLKKTKEINELLEPYIIKEENEIILNCRYIPSDIIENGTPLSGEDVIEYNVEKYISQFNNRIKCLLVVFSQDIRDRILITNPSEKNFFTEEESKLVSGIPMKETDQDTYEALMTPDKKEIGFWKSIGEEPPFWKECGMNWDKMLKDYEEEQLAENDAKFKTLDALYSEGLKKITDSEAEKFYEEGVIPSSISDIVTLGNDLIFRFNELPNLSPSTGGYAIEDINYNFEENENN